MEGMWSEHFPDAAAEKPAAAAVALYERCLICPKCNARSCRLLKSTTDKNPGRLFYKCPAPALDHKLFFKWADEVKPHELIEVPYCGGCTSGVCRVKREMRGPNAGRIMFMCRVKEGEGSCGYRVWKDELEISEAGQAEERMNLFAEVSCCEIEMRNLELQLEKIYKNKEVLEGKYLIASKELEESQKLLEQKEAERNAAKAAFNRAKALLRG